MKPCIFPTKCWEKSDSSTTKLAYMDSNTWIIITVIVCSFLCHFSFGAQGPLHETKRTNNKKKTCTLCDRPLSHTHTQMHTHTYVHACTCTQSVGLLEKIGFKRWYATGRGGGVGGWGGGLTMQGSRRCSYLISFWLHNLSHWSECCICWYSDSI